MKKVLSIVVVFLLVASLAAQAFAARTFSYRKTDLADMEQVRIFTTALSMNNADEESRDLQKKVNSWLKKNAGSINVVERSTTSSPRGYDGEILFTITIFYSTKNQ